MKRAAGQPARSREIFLYDLPRDYFEKLPDRLNAVTAEDAEAAAKKYLHPDQMILICVGDRAKIEPELKKLDLGAIEIRDADGKDHSVESSRRSFAAALCRTKFDNILRGCAGKKYFRDACLLQGGNIRHRNRAAEQHRYVVHSFLLEQIHQLRRQRIVRAGKNGKSDDVDVFLHGGGRDHLRRLAQPRVDHFHPGIAQARGQ